MASKTTRKKPTRKPVSTASGSGDRPTKQRRKSKHGVSEAIDQAIETLQAKLMGKDMKASISDLVRLIHLKKELDGERPRDVTVRWVEEMSETAFDQNSCDDKSSKDA